MKTRNALTLFLLILTALTLTACGKDKEGSDSSVISVSEKAEEGSDDPAEEQPSSSSSQEDQTKDKGSETNQKDEETDYINIYAPILDMTCDVIYNGYQDDKDYDLVPSGVLEMAGWMEKDELLESLGYIISDINKDGIMELMIGTLSNRDEIPMIFAGYTVKDNEPLNFLEGWYRSAYQYMDNGRFYYFGSGGAMYSAFGTYHINEDGTELVCEDFYFTGEKDNDPESIAFYHNTTGEWDSENSEELKLSEDDFWKISDELSSKCHAPDLIPFADYEYKNAVSGSADPLIEVDYLNDVADKYPSYEDGAKYMSSVPSEYAVNVLIKSGEDIKDFTFLKLELKDAGPDGEPEFEKTEVFSIPALSRDTPIVIPMDFPGDLPSNGFSFTGSDNETKTYYVSMSGLDGSLLAEQVR